MTSIALFGAGGKMGYRLAKNLKGSRFDVRHVEVSDAGKARLKNDLGLVLRRLPTRRLTAPRSSSWPCRTRRSARSRPASSTSSTPGTMVVALDAAAPFAGHLPKRDDLTYFVTHPCHPPIFNDETDMQAKKDHFGGLVRQAAYRLRADAGAGRAPMRSARRSPRSSGRRSCARTASPSSRWRCWSRACRKPSAPRCSSSCAQAMDECVARGVPEEAARDFLLGHMNVLGAVIFKEVDGRVLGCLQQGDRIRHPRADARRLEESLRTRGDRRKHPAHHLSDNREGRPLTSAAPPGTGPYLNQPGGNT